LILIHRFVGLLDFRFSLISNFNSMDFGLQKIIKVTNLLLDSYTAKWFLFTRSFDRNSYSLMSTNVSLLKIYLPWSLSSMKSMKTTSSMFVFSIILKTDLGLSTILNSVSGSSLIGTLTVGSA